MQIIPFQIEHIHQIQLQPAQHHVNNWLNSEHYAHLKGYTLLDDSGNVMFIGGLVQIYPHRFIAWSLIAYNAGKYMRRIIRVVDRYYRLYYRGCRIECTVDIGFYAGHRLAKLLGFELEAAIMRSYEIDKRDVSLYARII